MKLIGEEPSIDQPGKAYLRDKPVNVSALLAQRQEACIPGRNGQDLTAASPEDALQQFTCDGVIFNDKNSS